MSNQKVNKGLLLHLLTENELTRREIAKRVGCSAERVRQLEKQLLGRTGNEAGRERRRQKLLAIFGSNAFVKAAKRRGLNVEPAKRAPLEWYRTKLYVNGKLCLLRRAYKDVGYKGWYVVVRKPWQKGEVCILDLGTGHFLIIPMNEMPKAATMFKLYQHNSARRTYRGTYKLRHFWRKYLDNWSAFGAGRVKARVRN